MYPFLVSFPFPPHEPNSPEDTHLNWGTEVMGDSKGYGPQTTVDEVVLFSVCSSCNSLLMHCFDDFHNVSGWAIVDSTQNFTLCMWVANVGNLQKVIHKMPSSAPPPPPSLLFAKRKQHFAMVRSVNYYLIS